MLALVNSLYRPKVNFNECLGLFLYHFILQISVSQVTLVEVLLSHSRFLILGKPGKFYSCCNDSKLRNFNYNKWLQPQRGVCTQPIFVSVSINGEGAYTCVSRNAGTLTLLLEIGSKCLD